MKILRHYYSISNPDQCKIIFFCGRWIFQKPTFYRLIVNLEAGYFTFQESDNSGNVGKSKENKCKQIEYH